MSKFSKTLICLIAVFALSAIAASAASAAKPEFVFSGKKAFTTKSKEAVLETKGGEKVTCKEDTGKGEIEGASGSKKVTGVTIALKGCKTKVSGLTVGCGTKEEITTKELEGQLEYLPAGTKEKVGLDLWPKGTSNKELEEGKFTTLFTEFKCLIVTLKVRGSLIGEMKPVNVKVGPKEANTHFTLTYEQAGGVQKYTESEIEVGGKLVKIKDFLETEKSGGTFEQSGQSTVAEVFPEEALEISA
jgi:hypothetical protein